MVNNELLNMKLPFDIVLTPLLKPYLTSTKLFCQHPTFSISIPYTYIYGALGLFINIHHLKAHLGELPNIGETQLADSSALRRWMLLHDLKMTATSMGLLQYSCLVIGCLTENPSLFLPHLAGQLIIVAVKILNIFLLLTQLRVKTFGKLVHKLMAILLMSFNWLQEFCVFRQHLCICDL